MAEPTAWADINPTALAPRHERPISCSGKLRPATSDTFKTELTACLALVVPVGMTEEGRREWLSVAWITLSHLPPDLLARGCKVARETCDHPSKIVPTILKETEQPMKWRRESSSSEHLALPAPSKRHVMDRRGEPMSEEDTAELNRILEWGGAVARYKPDGSRWFLDGRDDPSEARR